MIPDSTIRYVQTEFMCTVLSAFLKRIPRYVGVDNFSLPHIPPSRKICFWSSRSGIEFHYRCWGLSIIGLYILCLVYIIKHLHLQMFYNIYSCLCVPLVFWPSSCHWLMFMPLCSPKYVAHFLIHIYRTYKA